MDNTFFAPVAYDLIDSLIVQANKEKSDIKECFKTVSEEHSKSFMNALRTLSEATQRDDRYKSNVSFNFSQSDLEIALSKVDSNYWMKALDLTDLWKILPQDRKDQLHKDLRRLEDEKDRNKDIIYKKVPEFTDESVRSTLAALLSERPKFFAERVDGFFRKLSKTHITNSPEGFYKRMIIDCSYTSHSYHGAIDDLRIVISKLMNKNYDERLPIETYTIMNNTPKDGKWRYIDGCALKFRSYQVGTVHIEVHPHIAWKLNQILHYLYPTAIPSEFREAPKKKKEKAFELLHETIDGRVLKKLGEMRYNHSQKAFYISSESLDLYRKCKEILLYLGAVEIKTGFFNHSDDLKMLVHNVICAGYIEDYKSHQFYPTPQEIGMKAFGLLEWKTGMKCLEPNAGHGNLAEFFSEKENVDCVEVSKLHCDILSTKGFVNVFNEDFIKFAKNNDKIRYDRILMNPPFSEGRAIAHISAALELLSENGVLVCITPESFKFDSLKGVSVLHNELIENEFFKTSINVRLAKLVKVKE